MIDTHAHLFLTKNTNDILSHAKEKNLKAIINICLDLPSLEKSILLEKKYNFIYTAAATSPQQAKQKEDPFFKKVEKFAKEKKIIAIGETGLDYFYINSEEEKKFQKSFFKKYILLAEETSLPLIIHARDSFKDIFEITKPYKLKAAFHCFTGNIKDAEEGLKRGWYISFSGILTFKNAENLRKVAKKIPLNKILVETDSPFLSPEGFRKKENEPSLVKEVIKMISKIKNKSFEEVEKITSQNALQLFSLLKT